MLASMLRDVRAGYGERTVLHGVSARLGKGRTTALIGPGGSGKSTVLKLIASCSRGLPETLWVTGNVLVRLDGLNMLAQKPEATRASLADLLGADPISGRDPYRWLFEFWDSTSRTAAMALARYLYLPLATLPTAIRRLAEFTAVVSRPGEILLIDEPECGARPREITWMRAKLASMRGHKTILVVTHNLSIAREISHETIFLLDGHVIESGPTRRMFSSPVKARTRNMVTMGA